MLIKSNSMLLSHVCNLYFLEISHNVEIKERKEKWMWVKGESAVCVLRDRGRRNFCKSCPVGKSIMIGHNPMSFKTQDHRCFFVCLFWKMPFFIPSDLTIWLV